MARDTLLGFPAITTTLLLTVAENLSLYRQPQRHTDFRVPLFDCEGIGAVRGDAGRFGGGIVIF